MPQPVATYDLHLTHLRPLSKLSPVMCTSSHTHLSCGAGRLREALIELTIEASVAAEAGQWRWAWSTAAVVATLRRMRADLKRAFAAVTVPASATISESPEVCARQPKCAAGLHKHVDEEILGQSQCLRTANTAYL